MGDMSERTDSPDEAAAAAAPNEAERDIGREFRLVGRLRRHVPVLTIVLVALVMGPFISRYIDSYRAVVLEVREGEMFIMETRRPDELRAPRWVDAIQVEPGTVVEKKVGAWTPVPVPALAKDANAIQVYERWMSSYEGPIVEIRPPVTPGKAYVAVVRTPEGKQIDVALWADHLAEVAVGKILRKEPRSWDPFLVPASSSAPAAAPAQQEAR